MAQVIDLLGALISVNIASTTGKKQPKTKPAPRPVTALGTAQKQARQAARKRDLGEIIETFTPGDGLT